MRAIRGAGELLAYDTALRIGAKFGLRPQRVYLHRGTREEAQAPGLNSSAPSLCLSLDELPKPLQQLAPYEIEECLCIWIPPTS